MGNKIILASLVIVALQSKAHALDLDAYLTLENVTIEQVNEKTNSPNVNTQAVTLPVDQKSIWNQNPLSSGSQFDQYNKDLDVIINMGEKIWGVIEKGTPVVNVGQKSANALPENIRNWMQLTGWQAPKSIKYKITYKNLFGWNVVSFDYQVVFSYNGQYITNATILPSTVSVAWGYKFQSHVEVPSVLNVGNANFPIAGLQMNLNWSVDTVFRHHEMTQGYFMNGSGLLKEL